MNTSLQDAANLGWKLAATLQGWAPEGLLDSYEHERRPVGRLVLRSSGAIIRLAMVRSRFGRWARNSVGSVLLGIPPIAHRVTGIISGVGIDYRDAPRVPDLALADGGRLYELLRQGTYVALSHDATGFADEHLEHLVHATPADPSVPATLVRPDGHLAYRGTREGLDAAIARAGLTGKVAVR